MTNTLPSLIMREYRPCEIIKNPKAITLNLPQKLNKTKNHSIAATIFFSLFFSPWRTLRTSKSYYTPWFEIPSCLVTHPVRNGFNFGDSNEYNLNFAHLLINQYLDKRSGTFMRKSVRKIAMYYL